MSDGIWKYCSAEQAVAFLRSFHLLKGTGISREQELAVLYELSNSAEKHYRKAYIPKRNGGMRRLQIPDTLLKQVQKNLLRQVLEPMTPSEYAAAYRKGKGLNGNAAPHVGKKRVLKLDLEDFFSNITFGMVLEHVFPRTIFPLSAAVLLTNLCCLKDCLPQGAPTSPAASNLAMRPFDEFMGRWCAERKISYTRYCDDLTFSGDFCVREVREKAENFLKAMGFSLNRKKTQAMGRGRRQSVTGIVVNEYPQVPKPKRREIRQEVYYCEKYGTEEHLRRSGKGKAFQGERGPIRYLQSLAGRAAFVLQIDPCNGEFREIREKIKRLTRLEERKIKEKDRMREEEIREAAGRFGLKGETVRWERYGSGHINETYRVECGKGKDRQVYLLQKINTDVFRNPEGLMENILRVTEFLRGKIAEAGGDVKRETLRLVPAADGGLCWRDSFGGFWRMFDFIEDSVSFDQAGSPEDFYQSARAFGRFQRLLADYPADSLEETIPDFHNTPKRLEVLKKAAEKDACGRAEEVRKEIRFFLEREGELGAAMELYRAGKLPLRVAHNDTKLNNILFDRKTGEALCIVDLDTVMPGFSIFDYGDSIRFGANTALEDERDLTKAGLSLELFECYTRGFLEGCESSLTETEQELLPLGAKLMTMECGMRFLTDYLQGDVYFHTERPGQNLDRARTQIALAEDMERKWEQMRAIVKKLEK